MGTTEFVISVQRKSMKFSDCKSRIQQEVILQSDNARIGMRGGWKARKRTRNQTRKQHGEGKLSQRKGDREHIYGKGGFA